MTGTGMRRRHDFVFLHLVRNRRHRAWEDVTGAQKSSRPKEKKGSSKVEPGPKNAGKKILYETGRAPQKSSALWKGHGISGEGYLHGKKGNFLCPWEGALTGTQKGQSYP